MECRVCREISSARIDGAANATEVAQADAHLLGCSACRAWIEAAHRLRREVVAEAASPPDLVLGVLTRIAEVPTATRWSNARIGLAVVALVEVLFAAQTLAAESLHGHEVHRHAAFMYLALAAGFAAAAWNPARAAGGVVPMTGVLLVCLMVSSVLDLATGTVTALAIVAHLVCTLGLVAAWFAARATGRPARMLAM